jgi:cyanophycinase-like exopeptidase
VGNTLPRLLVLIGSGELAAQMTRGHRMIAQRLAGEHGRISDVKAAIVDTPFGFQANADALSDTLVDHFARRVGLNASLASMRRPDIDPVAREDAYATIRDASFVFSGPGSPSYAVRTWSQSEIPGLFADKLSGGGALVLASAAALAVGRFTVPVYEIYKAGADPHWLAGLDVLSVLGISAAVLPHWDNAEGPGHDTRYAFIGEQRLLELERQLPDDVVILGIDEHTALLLDIDAGTASVMGRGGVTVRRHGIETVYPNGSEIPITSLAQSAPAAVVPPAPRAVADVDDSTVLARRLHEMVGRMADLEARAGNADGLVQALLDLRAEARGRGDYDAADAIRHRLAALGIEITDSPDGPVARFRAS